MNFEQSVLISGKQPKWYTPALVNDSSILKTLWQQEPTGGIHITFPRFQDVTFFWNLGAFSRNLYHFNFLISHNWLITFLNSITIPTFRQDTTNVWPHIGHTPACRICIYTCCHCTSCLCLSFTRQVLVSNYLSNRSLPLLKDVSMKVEVLTMIGNTMQTIQFMFAGHSCVEFRANAFGVAAYQQWEDYKGANLCTFLW